MKNKNPWKKFIVVVSALVVVMIVCVTTNVIVNTIISSVPQVNPAIQQQQNNNNNNNINTFVPDNGAQQGVVDNQNPQGGNPGLQGETPNQQGNVAGNQQGGSNVQTPVQNANNPMNYNKAQLVDFYNACLKKSYSQKMNASKVEQVDVQVSGIDIGNLNMDVDKFAQNIIANNTKKNGVVQTKTFVNGTATDGSTTVQQFVLPTNLYADAVNSIKITPSGNGYQMVITLKPEECAHNGTAKYNASCTWPLDVGVIDFGSAVAIESCTFKYPGTVLTAMIDGQGRVTAVKTEMPLTVANAQAKAVGITIKVGAISGKWTCVNELKFAG